MLAMWDRSAGRQSQAAHAMRRGFSVTQKRVRREYADAAEREKHCSTSKRRCGRDALGGLERGEAQKLAQEGLHANA